MTGAGVAQKTYKVVRTVTKQTVYEAVGADERAATDAVYWLDSSGRDMSDARLIEELPSVVSYELTESTDIGVCPDGCGHFLTHHNENGCQWNCECKTKGASSRG